MINIVTYNNINNQLLLLYKNETKFYWYCKFD